MLCVWVKDWKSAAPLQYLFELIMTEKDIFHIGTSSARTIQTVAINDLEQLACDCYGCRSGLPGQQQKRNAQ